MPFPQRPSGLYVVNGWYMELPGLVSPQFETLEGLSKKTGTATIVDAGTNILYKFNDQILDFGQITLSRTEDGSSDDAAFRAMVDSSIAAGIKFVGALVKLHYHVEVYRIFFEGLGFKEYSYPTLDINSGEKLRVNCMATVDVWTII